MPACNEYGNDGHMSQFWREDTHKTTHFEVI